ncbi:hypothetical protein RNZ50_23900 [Paracoccaceae bacterium Fryx2]|nr:hypothetical protein [Paracoccaceae bacterium Fryx2]
MKATPFSQHNLTRAIKVARTSGLEIVKTLIHQDGTIELIHSDKAAEAATLSPLDQWMKGRK